MRRKLKRSPLERDILVQLEEAGSEEVTVVVNSLDQSGERYPPRALVLDAFQAALRALVASGDVELVHWDRGDVPVATERVAALLDLRSWLRWEGDGSYWARVTSVPVVSIALKTAS